MDPEGVAPTVVTEQHRDVTSGGLRLRATEWAAADAPQHTPAVLALPGVLAPRYSFSRLAHALAPSFRTIAVDFPGFGESEKPSPARYPYGVSAFSEAITDLIAGLGLSRAHLLGHGVGGAVALTLAARRPELVRRLALIAPLAHAPRLQSTYRSLLAPVIGGLIFRQLLNKSWFTSIYRDKVHDRAKAEEIQRYYQSLNPPACRAALLATLRSSLDARSVIADSRRVRAPTLLVWGQDDTLLPLRNGRHLSREMPQAGLSLLPSGHAPHEELPEATAATLARFFSGNRAGTG